ncbi:MAG: hypothetical protein ACO3AV_09135, partial [Ilumatobacteraceae bacterium]
MSDATAAPDAADPTAPLVIERRDVWQRRLERLATLHPRRLALRTRILLMFGLGAMLLSGFLAAAAYSFTRSSVVNQRDAAGVEQAYRNAQVAQDELVSNSPNAASAVERLRSLGVSRFAIVYRDTWSASSAQYGPDVIPTSLQTRVVAESTPSRMIAPIDGKQELIIGVPLTVTDASYFEFVPLDDAQSTLSSVLLSLLFAGFITTIAGVMLGALAASRAVRPLGDAAQAAKAIAGGRLDTRLEPT